MKKLMIALMLTATGAALCPGAASAAPKHRIHRRTPAVTYAAPPLTVQRRSYLDPGNVVPVGSLNQYVWVPATQTDLYETGGLAWHYGEGALPGPFTAPGRPQPIGEF
jgi:hypothetical protein